MLLLQGSKFNSDYWLPVLNEWKEEPGRGGRIITCDWQPEGMTGGDLAEYFYRFFQTLGLHGLKIVACDDAAKLAQELKSDFGDSVDDMLVFAQNAPRGQALLTAVKDFLK